MRQIDQMQILGTNIAKTVRALGWTLKDLGDRSGLAREHVSRIVHGHSSVTVATASRIADAMSVSLSDLFREDFSPNINEEHAA